MLKATQILFVLIALVAGRQAAAQCQDTNTVKDPYYQCGPQVNMVCGCDGKTYYSECSAHYHGGLFFGSWTTYPCTDFDFFLFQDVIQKEILINFQYKDPYGGNSTMMIVDIFGKIVHQQFVNLSNNLPVQISYSLTGFNPGVYFVYIYSSKYRKVVKFVAG